MDCCEFDTKDEAQFASDGEGEAFDWNSVSLTESEELILTPLMLQSIDGRLSTSFGDADGEGEAPVTTGTSGGSGGVVPPFGNAHFVAVAYNGNKSDEEVQSEQLDNGDEGLSLGKQPWGVRTLQEHHNRRKLSSGCRIKRDNERVSAALADDDRVHVTTRGANFDLVLRYRPDGRFLLAGLVLRQPPSGWPYPVRSVAVWGYGASDDEAEPVPGEYSECFNDLDEGRSLVQDEVPSDLVLPLPLAYLHIGPDDRAVYVPLHRPVLVKYLHVKFISAYNTRSNDRAPNIEVGFLGLTGLCVPPGGRLFDSKVSAEEEQIMFTKRLPPAMVYGYRPPPVLISLTEEFYDYMLSHRFVYLFPQNALTLSRYATPFEDLRAMLNEVIKEGTVPSVGDLAFFHGPSPFDAQLARLCGLWNENPTIAFIDLHNQLFYVSNNVDLTTEKVRGFLHDCLAGTYPRQMRPSELARIGRLGSGAFGSVFKAVHKPTGEEVAVKVLTESKPEEVALLQMCRECPEIVQCRASFKNPRADSIWVVLEYCGGGSAWDLVDDMLFQMKEEHVATILKSVLTALVYLEEHGILHRDIKPDNILFTADGHVKLTDLGCGRVLKKGDMAVSQAGHIVTRPPEMGRMYYDHRSDIWSVGKVALLLARLAKLPEVIQIQHAEDVEYGDWHPFLRNFVQRCLQPQHSRDNAASMLQDPFITTFARDHTLFRDYCQFVELAKRNQLNQVKPVISLLDQLRLKDESTNQIAFILDVFSSTLQRCTGNEHLHIDLKEALELALIDHTTRILIIGGTREGKSSFINALAGAKLCKVSSVLKETMGCEWRDLNLGRDKIKIMDSRGNAEFDSNVVYEDEDFKSFVYIPEKTPLQLIKEELRKGHPDIVIFVAKAKQLDTQQNKENLLFLKEVLQFIRESNPRRPFPCVLGVASQVDELDPVRRPPADKLPVIEQARTILHSRMEECLRPLFEQVANESIEVGTSVTLDFQLAPKLSTFAVCSVVEWSDDGTEIVEDHRWGIDAVRRHLTEDGSVRVTLGLLATCRMQDQPRLVARAWANYYGQFINLVLTEQLNVPIQIWVLLAQLVVCTGLVTRTPHSNINSFFEQVAQLCFVDVPGKPGHIYVYRGMFSWKYRLLHCTELLNRVAEALGEFIVKGHIHSTPATFERLLAILWAA